MNGDVRFEGPTADKGTYRVTTHNGDIRVSLGAQANATVFVRTFGGDFSSDFPVTLPEGMSNRDGNKRFNFTLGGGSARVELQSFQGDIHVSRGAAAAGAPAPPRRRGHGHPTRRRSPPRSRPRSRPPSRSRSTSMWTSTSSVDVDVEVDADVGASITAVAAPAPTPRDRARHGRDRRGQRRCRRRRIVRARLTAAISPAPARRAARGRRPAGDDHEAAVAHDGAHRLVVGEHVAVEAANAERAGQLDERPQHRRAQSLALHTVGDEDRRSRRVPAGSVRRMRPTARIAACPRRCAARRPARRRSAGSTLAGQLEPLLPGALLERGEVEVALVDRCAATVRRGRRRAAARRPGGSAAARPRDPSRNSARVAPSRQRVVGGHGDSIAASFLPAGCA